jgi:5-methylcytosine-specific restriction endonuclease McrA
MNCIYCKKKLTGIQKKYCSNKCQADLKYDQYIECWLNGNEKGRRGEYSTSNHIRRWIFERDNNQCIKCGWSKTNPHTGKIPLVLDHIDGNHTNNDKDNLRTLCNNCDSLSSTYKNSNNGNGRHLRRDRYRTGKSY